MERGPGTVRIPPGLLNVLIGAWLILSTFVFRHAPAQRTNAWVSGILCIAFALAGMVAPRAKYLNTLLAVWLMASPWVVPSGGTMSTATAWTNVLCAIAIFIISLIQSPTIDLTKTLGGPRRV
jgi:hypothetical protein